MGRILHFIRTDTSAFDDLVTSAMGEAFDAACAELQYNNLSELVREIIAERMIDAAKRGERDPKGLRSSAVLKASSKDRSTQVPLSGELATSSFSWSQMQYRVADWDRTVNRVGITSSCVK